MRSIHAPHSSFVDIKGVQWGTSDEKSLIIEAVIIKLQYLHPLKGEFRCISELISKLV